MSIFDELEEAINGLLDTAMYAIACEAAKKMAGEYNLVDDDEAFEELWGLAFLASINGINVHDRAVDEVERLIARLPAILDRAPTRPTNTTRPIAVIDEPGMEITHVAETNRSYVIFSDHHMLFDDHRQNYFRKNGNRDLYVEILDRYYAQAQYTLVENGDVEELIILEPKLNEIKNIGQWSWAAIQAYRDQQKEPQLRSIVRDNLNYYRAVYHGFAEHDRYYKITGNHDRDMVSTDFAEIVTEELGLPFPRACDVLLLKTGDKTDYIICHGHQFDTSCTPKFAVKGGESFSQSLAWAFQGPDRIWRRQYDQMQDWLAGREPVLNRLVSDVPEGDGVFGEGRGQRFVDAIGSAFSNLNTERGWETLYGKNIAWNYFVNDGDPQKCINDEVKTGDRWFKYRHMNEFRLVDHLKQAFGASIPTLILGHTHEPRLNPLRVTISAGQLDTEKISFYINSGSAGRFENLIWGVEILDGDGVLISWHRDDQEEPVRTIWEDFGGDTGDFLRPASSARLSDLPMPEIVDDPVVSDGTVNRIAVNHML